MEVILDTQVLIDLAELGISSIPAKARKVLSDPATRRVVCSISIAELAIKTSIGKLESSPISVSRLFERLMVEVIPFTPSHAMRMYSLPLHHREPFDRMIIAMAISEGFPLIGSDTKFPAYKAQGLTVIWK